MTMRSVAGRAVTAAAMGRWRGCATAALNPLSVLPSSVRIYELAPRDGLQNEPTAVPTSAKLRLIEMLGDAGVAAIEATSFVSPKWVPQMADHKEILAGLQRVPGVEYPILVPNLKGFQGAAAAGASTVAVMTIPSESFARRNLNCTVQQTVERALEIIRAAHLAGVRVRGYISCALGCPFEGAIDPAKVAELATLLHEAGCYEVCLADTIGTGTAGSMNTLLQRVTARVPAERLAVHCHDTYGQARVGAQLLALANILCALTHGVAVVDASVAGLGGCPFAPGAAGNVATEDVVYMLSGLGVGCNVDFDAAAAAGDFIVGVLGRPNASRAANATAASRAPRASASASESESRSQSQSQLQSAAS